jgi:prevent-host-death family protein
MKTVTVRELQKKIRECVDAAQTDRIVITRHGRPAAIVIGVQGYDWEDVVLQTSPAFWKMIEARRKQKTIPLAEMRKRLDHAKAGHRRRPRPAFPK